MYHWDIFFFKKIKSFFFISFLVYIYTYSVGEPAFGLAIFQVQLVRLQCHLIPDISSKIHDGTTNIQFFIHEYVLIECLYHGQFSQKRWLYLSYNNSWSQIPLHFL